MANRDCYNSRYNMSSSLQDAKTKCGEDSDCAGVYEAGCKGRYWHLCQYHSISFSENSCAYIKEGKVGKYIGN